MHSPSKVFRLIIAALILVPLPQTASGDWKAPREALDNRRIQGEFRIYYTREGMNAFPMDVPPRQRAGQVSDLLNRLISQLNQADHFYSSDFGLTPPLQSKRYRVVRSIDVQILDLGEEMGTTGDGIVTYHYLNFDSATPAITISLSNRWKPPNLTPSHELFHAYQYGYTYFKNPWFLEGLARSMESAFKDAPPRSEPLPQNKIELQRIMSLSYGTDTFWNRLMKFCDPACNAKTSAATRHPQLCGRSFVRSLLEQYQAIDVVAAHDRGIDPLDWPEAEQRSEKNNPFLVMGLRQSLESQCPLGTSPELMQFDDLLKEVAVP